MSSAADDPNRWVQNPPSVFVKVHGTSRDAINGKLGLVLQYAADRQRYTVLMCETNDPASFKADNLIVCSFIEKGQAYIQLMKSNPDLQRQMQRMSAQVQQRTGLSPGYALAAFVGVLAVGWYLLGFSKVLMIVTVGMMLLTVVGPDLSAGQDMRTIVRNAPSRWKEVIRTQIPYIGPRIAANQNLFGAFTAALVAFFIYSLMATPAGRRAAATAASTASATGSNAPPMMHRSLQPTVNITELQERFYKLGFEDATKSLEFGSSFDAAVASYKAEEAVVEMDGTTTTTRSAAGADSNDPYAWRNMDITGAGQNYDAMPSLSKKKSPFSISTALAAFTIFRTLQPMAMNAEGKFDLDLFRANLSTMEVWKMGLVAFSLYRIVVAFV